MGMQRERVNGPLHCAPGYLTERIKNEILHLKDTPECEVIEYEDLIDSSLMSPSRWITMANDIKKNYDDYDGFVVIHGTDTMAYTASALSFMLGNLSKPVILTGSNIPMCETINDASRNLTVAIMYAAALEIPEVCIFFNNTLLRGNRTTKLDNYGLNAFESPNYPPLATLKVHTKFNQDNILPLPRRRLRVRTVMEENIVCIRLIPGFSDSALHSLIRDESVRGLVLEVYGNGTGLYKPELLDALKDAAENDVVVVAATQCLKGTVDLDAYSAGAAAAARVVSASDMTTEAAVTKLSFLLGNVPTKRVKTLMKEPICGELTPLREYKTDGLLNTTREFSYP